MRTWITALALAAALTTVPGVVRPGEEDLVRVSGVVSYVDSDERRLGIDADLYTVPPEVQGLERIEPGTAVILEYRQVGEERRVESVRIRRD
jgi:hypothetical protein